MSVEQMRETCEIYVRQIRAAGLEPADMTDVQDATPDQQLQHAAWMCGRIESFLDHMNDLDHPDGYPEMIALLKTRTWLGFVQGVLWSRNARTIREMRDDNRSKE